MPETPTAEAEWHQFTHDLALCLRDLDEDEYLVISHKRADYYVQFAAQGRFGMRAEAACNLYIEPPDARLTVQDYDLMTKLGWHRAADLPPNVAAAGRSPDGAPNFFVDYPDPVDFEGLAAMATVTFRDVYKLYHPGQLEYKAFGRDGTTIRFPTLRIKRAVN